MNLAGHMNHPDVTIEAHVARRRERLASELADRAPIYLDMRFWIMVREVRDGTSRREDEALVVRLLERLVERGVAFCPIGEPTFVELMKQGDPAQREATTRIVDELSLHVAILPDPERLVSEAEDLVIGRLTGTAPKTVRSAWTSACYVLGEIWPAGTPFDAATERAVQKAFFDHMWDQPLAAATLTLDSEEFSMREQLAGQARDLTRANAEHAGEMRSFEAVLLQEFNGVAETIVERSPRLRDALGPSGAALSRGPAAAFTAAVRELLRQSDDARLMPTAHVHAVLHAIFRWSYRDKQIAPNDLVDFRHAAAALGHCDVLLTEGQLHRTLTHRSVSLAEIHRTIVLSGRDEVGRHLSGMLSDREGGA